MRTSQLALVGRLGAGLAGAIAALMALPPAPAQAAPGPVTYARDVAPILFRHCTRCHHPGDIAPMSLMSYEQVRPWIKSIQQAVVAERTMPPWHSVDPAGQFSNDRRLNDAEIDTIASWIRQGAPAGDAAELPAAPEYGTGWRLGEPDYVMEFDPVEVADSGPDTFHNLIAVADFGQDRWVKAIEVKPGDRRVVHHVIVITLENLQASTGPAVQGWLAGWAAGTDPMVMPPGTGRVIPNGTRIVANMHYHPTGEAATDRTRVGFFFADEGEQLREVRNHWVVNHEFEIPPGAAAHPVSASYVFDQDTDIYTVTPHMHYRGKDMKMTLVLPDGKTRQLIDVPAYDFNWQTVYQLTEPVRAPKGSRLEIAGHFDNSPANEANPDASKTVIWGPESYDEMFIGILDVAAVGAADPTSGQ